MGCFGFQIWKQMVTSNFMHKYNEICCFSCTLMLNLSNSTLSWERIVHEMARGHILYPAKFAWQKVETAPTPLSGTSHDCFTTSHRTPRVTEDTKFMDKLKKHLQDFASPGAKRQLTQNIC
jgi:hypothetical protein